MSGEIKSAKDRLADFEKILNDYTAGIGLSRIQHNPEVGQIFTLTREELRGMDPEDCGECAVILSLYSSYIQTEQNRQQVRVDWAERELSHLIAREKDNYGFGGDKGKFTKYELLKSTIVVHDGAAKLLDQIITHARARAMTLDKISVNINLVSKSLIELQQTKRYRK